MRGFTEVISNSFSHGKPRVLFSHVGTVDEERSSIHVWNRAVTLSLPFSCC
ncbi:MSP domain-containing protein [Psidium guajava]|nr:MSP domain-containing protein [Psidium guajava]